MDREGGMEGKGEWRGREGKAEEHKITIVR